MSQARESDSRVKLESQVRVSWFPWRPRVSNNADFENHNMILCIKHFNDSHHILPFVTCVTRMRLAFISINIYKKALYLAFIFCGIYFMYTVFLEIMKYCHNVIKCHSSYAKVVALNLLLS
jgi:hypothetical protein